MANSIDELLPGEWYQFPSSRLDQSGVWPPSPQPPGTPATIMTAWSGGLWDWRRNRLIIHGGGHGDYSGNEICAFSISSGTWARIWGPTDNAFIPALPATPVVATYTNGDPRAVHSYDGLIYIPDLDRYMRFCGSVWSGGGDGTQGVWSWNPVTATWTRKTDWPANGGVSVAAEYDASRGIVWVVCDANGSAQLNKYNPYTNSWTTTGQAWQLSEDPMLCIDPDNDVGVYLGNGRVFSINLTNNAITQRTTTGPQNIVTARGPGLQWDPVMRRVVGWMGGTSVYSLNTSTWAWTQHSAAGSNTVTPPTLQADTRIEGGWPFSKFQYIPSKSAYVVVNSVSGSVYAYRLTTNPFPNRTWASKATPSSSDGPYSTGGKHGRQCFDSRRGKITYTGGDYTDSLGDSASGNGNARIWQRDLLTIPANSAWTSLHSFCSTSGQLMPSRPDNVGWVYDSTRNKFYTIPGYFNETALTSPICPNSSITRQPVQFDPATGLYTAVTWTPPSGFSDAYGGDLGATYAVYDPLLDRVYRFRVDQMEYLNVSTGLWTSRIGNLSTQFPDLNPQTGAADCHSDQSVIDVEGRAIYCYLRSLSNSTGYLCKFNLNTNLFSRISVPSSISSGLPTLNNLDIETWMAFDPISRRILLPSYSVSASYDGIIQNLGIFNVDTNVWEVETPNASDIRCNCIGFDPQSGVMHVLGRGTSNFRSWTYRFGTATAAPPTAPDTPILNSPANGATGVSIAPTLIWNAAAGATTYQLQVSTVSNFASTVFDQSALTSTSQGLSGLTNLTQYFWRVNATNAVGTSTFSSVFSFTTVSAVSAPAPPSNLRFV